MPSARATLLASVVACLQRIQVADGYNTDAGQHVTLESGQVPEGDEYVVAPLVARQERSADAAVRKTHRATTLAIVVKLPADIDQRVERIDAIVQDVERAMADQAFRYPVGYQFPQYQAMEALPPQPGAGWAGAVVSYTTNIPIH